MACRLGWARVIRWAAEQSTHWQTRHTASPTPPPRTGTLSTAVVAGDSADSIQELGRHLCILLSFSSCLPVDWCTCALLDSAGQVIWEQHRAVRRVHYETGQGRIEQDYPQLTGVIRAYMEQCYPRFAADLGQLSQALAVYVEAQLADTTLVRAALLNMLLDRLQKEINEGRDAPQVDRELETRVDRKEFKERLRTLLAELSPNWTPDLTGRIIGEIKRLNTPGFGRAVRLAFESLGVQGFDRIPLGTRHVVLHEAELPLGVNEVIPYLSELDLLVFLIIACRLGYTGQFWHPHLGNQVQRLEDLLAQQATREENR